MFAGLTSQQSIADELKHKVDRDTDATGVQRESARHAIAAFERAEWQPQVFERFMPIDTLAMRVGEVIQIRADAPGIRDWLLDYLYEIEPDVSSGQLYGTADAGVQLNLTTQGVKYHLHQTKLLRGTLMGKTLVFTEAQLNTFRRLKPAARGPKAK